MAGEIEEWKVRAYVREVYHLAQATRQKLSGTTQEKTETGKSIAFRRLAPSEGRDVTEALSPIIHSVHTHSQRVCFPTPWSYDAIVDTFEKAQQIHEPENEYAKSGASSYNRRRDKKIIDASLGAAAEGGEAGAITLVPFDTTNQRIVHATSQLTVAKVLQARAMLGAACNEELELYGPLYFVYHPLDLRALLKDAQVTSTDFVGPIHALMRGEMVDGFMGFNWRSSTQLPLVSNIRSDVCYAKSAMGVGNNFGAKKERMGERNDITGHPMQVSVFDEFNAVRIDDKLVIEVQVDTTAAL
jgi:Phage capsid protein